jgi:hypothetical protein
LRQKKFKLVDKRQTSNNTEAEISVEYGPLSELRTAGNPRTSYSLFLLEMFCLEETIGTQLSELSDNFYSSA